MRIRGVLPLLCLTIIAGALMAPMAVAQEGETTWYMTAGQSSTRAGAQLLSTDARTGAGATHQFVPAVAGTGPFPPNSYEWATDAPFEQEFQIDTATEVTVFFDTSVDVAGTLTATLSSIASDGTVTELATASTGNGLQIPAHAAVLSLPTEGAMLPADSTLLLTVSVTGLSVLIQMDYGGGTTASGFTLTGSPTFEPTLGTGSGEPGMTGDNGSDDDKSPEVWIASTLLTICLAAAGIARIGRFPA